MNRRGFLKGAVAALAAVPAPVFWSLVAVICVAVYLAVVIPGLWLMNR